LALGVCVFMLTYPKVLRTFKKSNAAKLVFMLPQKDLSFIEQVTSI
jgi:hypothetical protein